MTIASPKSSSAKLTLPTDSENHSPLQFREVEVVQDLDQREPEHLCPLCCTPTRAFPGLTFTEAQIIYKGTPLHFRARKERELFRYLFERRGRLVPLVDLHDEFVSNSVNPNNLTRVYIRSVRETIMKHRLPIDLQCVWGEGYVMNVRATRVKK